MKLSPQVRAIASQSTSVESAPLYSPDEDVHLEREAWRSHTGVLLPAPNRLTQISACRQQAALARRCADVESSRFTVFTGVVAGLASGAVLSLAAQHPEGMLQGPLGLFGAFLLMGLISLS